MTIPLADHLTIIDQSNLHIREREIVEESEDTIQSASGKEDDSKTTYSATDRTLRSDMLEASRPSDSLKL